MSTTYRKRTQQKQPFFLAPRRLGRSPAAMTEEKRPFSQTIASDPPSTYQVKFSIQSLIISSLNLS